MRSSSRRPVQVSLIAIAAAAAIAVPALANGRAFLHRFTRIGTLASMVPGRGPAKGDENPYGVAVVSRTTGGLVRGDVLVSNFNNAKNEQGTGSSIVEVSPAGKAQVFSVVPGPRPHPRSA